MVKSTCVTSQSTVQIYLAHPWNLIKTAFLVISWIILSLHFELIGPTMSILAHNTHVTYNGIASVLASRSGGYLVADMLCAIFQKTVENYSDLILAISFFLPAIVVFATPFITSIILMCILLFVQGLAMGFANMGGNNLLFGMWGVNAAAPLNAVHLGYGFGAIFANLLVRPFLGNEIPSHMNVTMSSQLNSNLSLSVPTLSNSDIRIPYSITAGLCLLIGVGHLVIFMRERKTRREKIEIEQVDYAAVSTNPSSTHTDPEEIKYSQYSPSTCGHGDFGYGLALSSIFIAYMFFVGGTDQTFSKFYFSYLKFEKFGISTGGASWGIILYWLSYSIGRLIGAITSVFIPVYICLIVVWFGGFLLAVAWMIYVWILGLTATSLFVLGSLTGLIISPIFPLSFGWINQRLNVVPSLLGLLLCGSALGSLVLQKIAGFVMDRDPNHFPTLLTVCVILPIILYIVSNTITFFHQRRLKNTRHQATRDAVLTSEDIDAEKQ